ncbi:uncharacterized protein [Panulirus ornatus]|uniref:uncharacterized protein n=1 Tax=Panulirus ornatus TaxID=150431 RepID=UPI003A8A1C6C
MTRSEKVQCRKCRRLLLSKDEFCILDAHGQEYHDAVGITKEESRSGCSSVEEHNCLYLSEDSFPDYILTAVNESSWTKGKIHCPGCGGRLGSFNFVSGSQCACGSHVLPQVHLLRSKVDWMKVGEALPCPVSFPDHAVALSAVTLPFDTESTTCKGVENCVSDDGSNRDCSSVLPAILQTSCNDASFKLGERIYKSEVARKYGRQIRHRQHGKEKDTGVEETSTTAGCSDADLLMTSSNFEVLTNEDLSEDDLSKEQEEMIPEHLQCPVCLDILYSPLVARPCGHTFCEPCLRRLAQTDPTHTLCPLCRQTIGQCMPCPELATEVRENFSELYRQRRQFELQHNSQHMPLPWLKNFRLRYTHQDGHSWIERAGGWWTVMWMMSLNILGIGILLYLGRPVKDEQDLHVHPDS